MGCKGDIQWRMGCFLVPSPRFPWEVVGRMGSRKGSAPRHTREGRVAELRQGEAWDGEDEGGAQVGVSHVENGSKVIPQLGRRNDEE